MLSKPQIKSLITLARRAYQMSRAKHLGLTSDTSDPSNPSDPPSVPSAASVPFPSFEDWRHAQVALACGKNGLKCASNNDFNAIKAHFLCILGEDGQALNALVREANQPIRQARYILNQELARANLPCEYAEHICHDQNKCLVADASVKQVWRMIFTIRNRAATKRRETQPF